MQCSTIKYSTVQYNTVQYSGIQHSTVEYGTVLYSTAQYNTVQYSTVLYSTVQYSTVQYSTEQYSTNKLQYNTLPTKCLSLSDRKSFAVELSACEVYLLRREKIQHIDGFACLPHTSFSENGVVPQCAGLRSCMCFASLILLRLDGLVQESS